MYFFSSTGRRPEGLLSWQFIHRLCVRASVNSFFVSLIGHKISDEFNSEQNLPSNSRAIAPEILKIAIFDLVFTIETTFHKVIIGTRSPMSLIMSEICQVAWKLFALELLKIAVLNLVSAMETTFLNQSGPKLHKVFIGTRSLMCLIMRENSLVTQKLFALELLKIVVYVHICIFTICHHSSSYIYGWILI